MKNSDRWGPFASGLDVTERTARLRCLQTISHLRLGSGGADLVRWLACSEVDVSFLDRAVEAIDRLASLDRRNVLASYLSISTQPAPWPL